MPTKEYSLPSSDSTIQQFRLPLTRRLINWTGRVGKRFGINTVNLSEGSLLKAALHKTGLSDWGEDDFLTPLKMLLDSLENEANLTVLGRITIRQTCLRLLVNRLSIRENLRLHPEIRDIRIRRPLFIVGLPRTGTTLLHNLLAQDPHNRVPLFWELLFPSPLFFRENHKADFRLTLTRKRIDQIYTLAPQIFSIHPYNPTGPEECIILFQNTFKSLFFPLYYHIPKYTEWLLREDMVGAYQYFLRQLQLLHWQRPGKRWVLKSPAHLYFLDALLAVFPDACFIQTHRDPRKIIPSICSLSGMATKMSSDRLPLNYLGEKGLFLCKTAIDRGMKVRASVDASHFYDVQYQDLVADPITVVRSIYDYFGYDVKVTMETGMKNWLRANPQHKYGIHRYSLDEFDLDQETIDTQFAAYREQFKVQSA